MRPAPLPSALYVVATPIGNLNDMSARAVSVLAGVDLIAAEDTRHSSVLLARYGIPTPTLSFHEHNEAERAPALLERLKHGERVALISDAGTPLVSDPGFNLVRAARRAGINVIAVPGACAAIAALSIAGLPTDRFVFEGFSPAKAAARRARFAELAPERRTLIFYESPHRIEAALTDLASAFGPAREAVLARELTKQFETTLTGTLGELRDRVHADPDQRRGEIVLVVRGASIEAGVSAESERILRMLLEELPLKQAAALASRISGEKRNALYELALKLGR